MFRDMSELSQKSVTDNAARRRFELVEEGQTAFADYFRQGERVVIPHVEAPMALRGKGTAGRLMQGVAEIARDQGLKLYPTCSYAVAWFRRHPEWRDVLA